MKKKDRKKLKKKALKFKCEMPRNVRVLEISKLKDFFCERMGLDKNFKPLK
jgi:hypothetical protein